MSKLPFVFGIVYAAPKKGKTLNLIKADPSALIITPVGGTSCAEYLGVKPETWLVKPDTRVDKIIEVINRASKSKKFRTIIVDDFSLIADSELHHIQTNPRNAGFKAFDVLNKTMYKLRDAARNAECHVFLVMHETPPREVTRDNKTVFIPGHPSITGWKLPEKIPAMADFVVRVKYDAKAVSNWPYVYQAAPTPDYITGSRLAMMPAYSPTNIREVMLATGYDLPRPEGMEWMDDVAEAVCQELVKAEAKDKRSVKKWLSSDGPALAETYKDKDPRHVRWAISDGIDRAVLRRHKTNLLSDFIDNF
jgi:hypothetical protein